VLLAVERRRQRRDRRTGMGVRNRQAQRVGGVLAGQAGQLQQPLDHLLHLVLLARPWPTMAFFICSAVYSATGRSSTDQRRQRRAAGLAQQQRALRVDVDEHDLDRRAVGW
jgi:hypothetical protein